MDDEKDSLDTLLDELSKHKFLMFWSFILLGFSIVRFWFIGFIHKIFRR